jgi:UPF0755 protein
MAVQIDATVQYAVGYQTSTKFGKKISPMTISKLRVHTIHIPYRSASYTICNPGIEALEAAANPESHDYLFYITDQMG